MECALAEKSGKEGNNRVGKGPNDDTKKVMGRWTDFLTTIKKRGRQKAND